MKTVDDVESFIFPSIYLTRNSKQKWVRLLGQIAVIVPLSPWTIFAIAVVIVLAIISLVAAGLLEWWKGV